MADKEHTDEKRDATSTGTRQASQEGPQGFGDGVTGVPLRQLQHQVGNAHVQHIARALAGEDGAWPEAEVGLAGGAISNRLASQIYGNLGSGRPLDGAQQDRWEAAFGSPLDDVRLHDDPEADELSRRVSARAFTLGSDIFLSHEADASDDHLMGHELAHVVQQQSAAPSSQLTVGPAGNSQEHAAEIAAEMGTIAGIPNRTPGIGRTSVQRDVAEDLDEMAGAGEQEQREQLQTAPPPVMQVNNVQDASGARRMMTTIEGFRPNMQEGGRQGTISGDQISANEEAIAKLSDYLVTVGEQGRTLGTFQEQVQQLRLDFGRVSGRMIHLQAMGVVTPNESASFRAEEVVGAATGAGSAAESAAGMRGDATVIRAQAQEAHDRLMTTGNNFTRAQREASQSVHGLNSALSTLNAGIIPREEDPDLAAQQRAIKAKVSTMQSRLSTGLQVLSALGGAAGLGTAATEAATSAVGEAATNLGGQALGALSPDTIATAISQEWYREQTNQIEAQISQANAQSRQAAITANVSGVRQAQTALFSAMQTLEERLREYQQARDSLRTTLTNLGAAADRPGGPGGGQGYTVMAGLLGDVDVLVVQIDTAMGMGRTEMEAGRHATEARGAVEGTRNAETGSREGGVTYYQPYQDFQLGNWGRTGGIVYRASPQRIYFITSQRTPGSAYGGQGAANPVVQQTMEELQEMRTTVQAMRSVLSQSMGLSMER